MDSIAKVETLLSEGSLKDAKDLLDHLLKEESEPSFYLHYLVAVYHIRSGAYDLAVPHLLKIEESESSPYYLPQVYKLLGYCTLMQEDYEQGEKILKEFDQMYYSDTQVKNMIAFACYIQGKIEEASALYEDVLSEDQENLTALNGMACILVDYKNNPQLAIDMLEPYGQKSEDPRILDTLGWAYFCVKEMEKAKLYLRRALDLLPMHPEVNRHMARLMLEL